MGDIFLKNSNINNKIQDEENNNSINNQVEVQNNKVAFYKLFSFADSWDIVLMILGSISAIANGVAKPLMLLVLGQIINSVGTSDPKHVIHNVSTVCYCFF